MWNEKRVAERHLVPLPIKYRWLDNAQYASREELSQFRHTKAKDISSEGLLFLAKEPYEIGALLDLSVPAQRNTYHMKARVVHSEPDDASELFRIGVQFLNQSDLFKLKMAEQLYEIVQFQRQLSLTENRDVSCEEAAERWIRDHSDAFSEFYK